MRHSEPLGPATFSSAMSALHEMLGVADARPDWMRGEHFR
jgi:hypothetical protein